MNTAFLYPSSPLNVNQVDENFKKEYLAIQEKGFVAYLIDIDHLQNYKSFQIPKNIRIVYRGWMFNEAAYTQLEQIFGDQLMTSKQDYFNAHYLPNWYYEISSLTIPSIITDVENVHHDFTKFSRAFIKDYAKSLKTGLGSIVYNRDDIKRALRDMVYYRGFIEGGIVLREVVDLMPNSEVRFFVKYNVIFSPKVDDKKYQIAQVVCDKIKNKNLKFYSIDIATTTEGKDIVIEIGDGQVSDYVGWNLKDFIKVLSCL